MKNVWMVLSLISFLAACASSQEAPPVPPPSAKTGPSQEARFAANQNNAAFVSEVVFAKGSSRLSESARKKVREVMQKSQSMATVKEVKVITWADEEYPSVHTRDLSSRERKLARDRAESIKRVLQAGEAKVEILNMAERPGALSSLWQSDDARIKKSLEVAGIPNTDTAVKSPSKAGHGIVMVILQE